MISPELVSLDEPITEDVAREWRDLVAKTGGSFFQTPDWIGAWATTVGRDQMSVAAIWRLEGRIKAVVALARVTERLHPRLPITVRYWTNAGTGPGSADHAGWAMDEALGPDVVAWLRSFIGGAPMLLRNVDGLLPALRDGFQWHEVGESLCPRLTPGEYLRGEVGSNKLRKTIRNARRRLVDMEVKFDWYPVGRVTHEIVDDLFELHGDRRDMVGGSSSFSGRDRYALHQNLVRDCQDEVGPVAVVARMDGRTVGVLYGFMFGSVFSYFQSGWDPEFSSMSIGSVLVDESIRRAADSECEAFDFLRGPEPYKYRFGAEDVVDRNLLTGESISARLIRAKHAVRSYRSRCGSRS